MISFPLEKTIGPGCGSVVDAYGAVPRDLDLEMINVAPASVDTTLDAGQWIVVVRAFAVESACERLAALIHHELPIISLGAKYHSVHEYVADDVARDLTFAVEEGTCDVRAGLVQRHIECTGCRAARFDVPNSDEGNHVFTAAAAEFARAVPGDVRRVGILAVAIAAAKRHLVLVYDEATSAFSAI